MRARSSPHRLLDRHGGVRAARPAWRGAVYRLLAWGTIPVGALLGGALAELVGLRAMFAVAGLVAVLPIIALLRVHEGSMRRAEEHPW